MAASPTYATSNYLRIIRISYLEACLENIVALRAEDHDALIKMVMLHGRGRIQNGQRRLHLGLEGVVGTSVVQVVTEACHEQAQYLKHAIYSSYLRTYLETFERTSRSSMKRSILPVRKTVNMVWQTLSACRQL